jgi:plastocyanin
MTHRISFRPLLLGIFSVTLTACANDTIAPVAPPDTAQLYWSLQMDLQAATVAVGGHQQVRATPLTLTGSPIPGLPAPTFTSGDTAVVTVDSLGLVTGLAVTSGVPIIASLTAQGITYADTVMVAVTPHSAIVKALAIVLPEDGPILRLDDDPTPIVAIATDDNGQVIPGIAVAVTTLDPYKIDFFSYGGPPLVQGKTLGKARIVATTTSYGVTKADTVEFSIQYSMFSTVSMEVLYPSMTLAFSPTAVAIGVGGEVSWYNHGSGPMSIVFDTGVEHIEGGNIPEIDLYNEQSRRFLAAGTYTYRDTVSGTDGKVIVYTQPTP